VPDDPDIDCSNWGNLVHTFLVANRLFYVNEFQCSSFILHHMTFITVRISKAELSTRQGEFNTHCDTIMNCTSMVIGYKTLYRLVKKSKSIMIASRDL